MSQDGHVLRVVAIEMTRGATFARHIHATHQLIWSDAGVLEVTCAGDRWVLPCSRALWVPAQTPHETRAVTAGATLRGVHLRPERCDVDWPTPQPIAVSALLAALLVHLAGPLSAAARGRAEVLIPDLLTPVDVITLQAGMPEDDRARAVAASLRRDPTDARTLQQWGTEVGASARTLNRLFVAQTGQSFGRWRTTVRMHAALEPLAQGVAVARVAELVGYETPSAFVAAFRRITGMTPGACFARHG